MKIGKKSPGYILVFSLAMIALVIVLATRIVDLSSVHVRFTQTMLEREHAKILAWSGVSIAMSQLSVREKEKKKGKEEKKEIKKASEEWTQNEAKLFLKTILPVLNEWQTFVIKKDKFGINGTVKICISSEDGKIDLNQLFDFEKKKFIGQGQKTGDYKKILQQLFKTLQKKVKGKSLFEKFEEYLTKKQKFEQILKNRQNRLYDTTEFLGIKEFEVFEDKVFKAVPYETKKGENKKGETVYWTDIFTLWSGDDKVNPWFLSDSIMRLSGLKGKKKIEEKKTRIEKLVKQFKHNLSWPDDWNKIFAKLYGVEHKNLPNWAKQIMGTTFAPNTFCVLSYGTVGKVTQKLCAIFERKKISKGKEKNKEMVIEFEIKKFYWI